MDNIERRLRSIDEKLSMLLKITTKETWVKVHVIHRLTGWDSKDMRMLRDEGLIKYKNINEGGKQIYLYLLESIPPIIWQTICPSRGD